MERLTKRDEYGNADIIGVDSEDLQLNLSFDEFNKVTAALNKLADYEDLEEQGLLPKLPCKVGQRVYEIYRFLDEGAWEIDVHKIKLEDLEKIGKTVFLT